MFAQAVVRVRTEQLHQPSDERGMRVLLVLQLAAQSRKAGLAQPGFALVPARPGAQKLPAEHMTVDALLHNPEQLRFAKAPARAGASALEIEMLALLVAKRPEAAVRPDRELVDDLGRQRTCWNCAWSHAHRRLL